MGEDPSAPPGLLESLRKLGRTGLATVENRLELFAVELGEQKARLVKVLTLAMATVFLGNTALLVITAAVVLAASPETRLPVLVGLSLLYVAVTVGLYLALRKELRSAPPPFQDTISELKKDSDCLKPRN